MVEFRKLIAFGKSSYVISLPKKWIERNKLDKGDTIFIEEKSHSLTLRTKQEESDESKKEITINVDNVPLDYIKRKIVSSYINNYKSIKITGKTLKDKYSKIRDYLHDLMALEILEQSADVIVAKDFINMNQVSLLGFIRKIDNITRFMMNDSKTSIIDNKYENIYERDKDVNRIGFLIYRTIKFALINPSMCKKLNVEPVDLLYYWVITKQIEFIADECKRIARVMRDIHINKQLKDEIIKIYEQIQKFYADIMKAYYTKNEEEAYKIAAKKNGILKIVDDFNKKYQNKKNIPVLCDKFKNLIANIHIAGRMIYT